MQFNFGREWVVTPSSHLRIECGDERVSRDAHRRRRGIEEAKVTRVRRVHLIVSETSGDKLDCIIRRDGACKVERRKARANLSWIRLSAHRQLCNFCRVSFN